MVTVNVHWLEFVLASVATQVTLVVPRAKREPDAGVQMTATFGSQASVTAGVNVTGVPAGPAHSRVILLAQTICGGVVSTTVMTWVQVLVFPQPSVPL